MKKENEIWGTDSAIPGKISLGTLQDEHSVTMDNITNMEWFDFEYIEEKECP